MKTKVFRIGKQSISLLLSVLMVISMMLVGMVTTTAAISYWYVSGSFNGWIDSVSDTYKLVDNKVTVDMNDYLNQEITFKMIAEESGNKWCGYSGSSAITSGSKIELSWNGGNDIKFTPTQRYVTFTISVENGNNYLTVTESAGSSESSITKWHITGYQDGNDNISWDINKLYVNGSTGSVTLNTNGNTNKIYFKPVAEKSDGTKYLCTAKGTSDNIALTKDTKSDALDWYAGASDNPYKDWTSFDSAVNSSNCDINLTYTPSSSSVTSVTFTISSDGSYNYVTVSETTSGGGGGDTPSGDSNYYLWDSATSTNLGTFSTGSTNSDGTTNYTLSIQMTAGQTYKLWLGDNQSGGEYYYAGSTLTAGGSKVTMYHYHSGSNNVEFTPDTSAVYKFTWVCNPDTTDTTTTNDRQIAGANSGKLSVELDATALAASVDITNNASGTIMIGETVTLTATVNEPADGVSNFKYTFYEGSTKIHESDYTTSNPYSYEYTPTSTGTKSYYVVVSTTDGDDSGTFGSVKSGTTSVTVGSPGVYYSSDLTSGYDSATWTEITGDKATISTTVSAGGTYTFALSDKNEFNDEFTTVYSWDQSKSSYCTISTGGVAVGDGVITYIVKCNTGCTAPKITIDKSTQTIYAVAAYKPTMTKTESSSEKVTYYFGEMADNVNWVYAGNGVKINYWNNSTGKSGSYVATEAVNVNGSNAIYVDTNEWYNGPGAGVKKFYVYKAELPIWATTFAFVDSSGSQITSSSNSSAYTSYGTLALNPNRIYLFYGSGDSRYTKGVVLDEQLWSSSNSTNVPGTKGFKSNLVNYNDDRGTLNSRLSTWYSDHDYGETTLYFGDFNYYDAGSTGSLYNFNMWNNLAQRANEKSYFASVWGLVGSKLSYSNARSISSFGQLMAPDNTTKMPLFYYDGALESDSIAGTDNIYTDLRFPFYESDFNGVTTYSYDSITDLNRRYDSTTGNFKVSSSYETGQDTDSNQFTGYFPFYGNTDRQSNCGFGTEFQIEFYMTDTGKLLANDGTYQDIAFNFSGDDDVWVYVDGILALDLGGDHKISAGTINFSDMKVYYKSAARGTDELSGTTHSYSYSSDYVNVIDLEEILGANGVDFDNTDPSTKHTLQMFYMERGLYQSNCSISFNLPQNSGLLVSSKVDTSKVQSAFVSDTLVTANNDFFKYFVENRIATYTETTNVNNTYGSSVSRATTLSKSGLNFDSPLYPLSNVVNRVFSGVTLPLAVTNSSTQSESSDYIGSKGTSSSFIDVANVNYKLNDAYSKSDSDEAAALGVTGRTASDGGFNLLFGESAQFTSKITPNTLLAITQSDTINSVTTASGSAISAGTSTRNVKDYYTTTYTITDDRNSMTIIDANTPVKNASGVLAKDSTTNGNSFMFANYADATDSSIAMTATFTNSVEVGSIKIQKELADGIIPGSDKFFFEVSFSNVFGGTSNTSKTYSNLTYDIYNIGSTTPVATDVSYNLCNAVRIQADQYALIKGVPVGTKYTITERSAIGYSLETVETSAEYVGNGTATAPTVTNGVVTGTIPTVDTIYDEATTAGYTSISEADFFNIKQAITVTFKYFDRLVENGVVSHISETATVYNKTFADYPSTAVQTSSDGEVTALYLDKLITAAAVEFGTETNVTNVIDDYKMWTSQAAAYAEMKNTTYIKNNRTYGTDGQYRTDCYGNPTSEKWITYYDENGDEVTDAESSSANHGDIKSITVWLFNQPKEYTVTMYTADSTSDILQKSNGRYVAKTTDKFEKTAFYNMRFGGDESYTYIDENGETVTVYDEQNKPGFYLEAYGIKDGYIGDSATTETSFDLDGDDIDDIIFIGWAIDPDGKYIVSSDLGYYYRITGDITLYAVYGDPEIEYEDGEKPVGLTVYKNQPDVYFDSNGVSKTRLNTQMSPYNCPMNDENITEVSIVYVMLTGDSRAYELTDAQVETIREDIQSILSTTTSTSVSGKVTVVSVEKNANGFIYNVVESSGEISATNDVILTTKNRIQFSTTFSTSNLEKGIRMLAFGAMNYSGEGWIVSDNYVDYDYYSTAS